MNLWWLVVSKTTCGYDELKSRGCIPLGWSEIGSLAKYVKDKPGWERQFKTFVQLRGNIAYQHNKSWLNGDGALDGVPKLFWEYLHIKKDDYIAVMETGNQLTLGNIEVRGIAKVTIDSMKSYGFNENYHHSHQVCSGLEWRDWQVAKFGVIQKPSESFKALKINNDQMKNVHEAWQILTVEQESLLSEA